MAHMLRCLFFLEAKWDMRLTAVHVPGVENGIADAVSRNNLDVFFHLLPQANPTPEGYPRGLVEGMVVP